MPSDIGRASSEVMSSRLATAGMPVSHISTKQPGIGAGPPRLAAAVR
jgi:hypothetical protein